MNCTRYNANAIKPTPERLSEAVAAFLSCPAAQADLISIYADADRAIAEAGGICLGGGACCRFDLLDHRVWLTTAELGQLLCVGPEPCNSGNGLRCPYQHGPDCAARVRRPLGCRTFFCRPTDREYIQEIHREMHRRIGELHQRHCIPYAYAEMTEAVLQLSVAK